MKDTYNRLDLEYGLFHEDDVQLQEQKEQNMQDSQVNSHQQTNTKQQSQKTTGAYLFY